jgi:hypothetical protein
MKNKKIFSILAFGIVAGFAATYIYKKYNAKKAAQSPALPESVAKGVKSTQDAIKKYGSISNVPTINDSKLALAISTNNENFAINS